MRKIVLFLVYLFLLRLVPRILQVLETFWGGGYIYHGSISCPCLHGTHLFQLVLMVHIFKTFSPLLILTCLLAQAGVSFAMEKPRAAGLPCTSFAKHLEIADTTIITVEHHKRRDMILLPNLVKSCRYPNTTATTDLCRVVVDVASSSSSKVRIESWLPDTWNGRFLATGTGGEVGCVDYSMTGYGAALGFASHGTNAGHDGQTGFDFFLNKPETIIDFGYRAIHIEAVVGKEIS